MGNRYANAGPKGGYDAWKSTTPDDQADADEARASRQEAIAEQAANDDGESPIRLPLSKRGDLLGKRAHPEDYTK